MRKLSIVIITLVFAILVGYASASDVTVMGYGMAPYTYGSVTYNTPGTYGVGDGQYIVVYPSNPALNDPYTKDIQVGWNTFSTPLQLRADSKYPSQIFGTDPSDHILIMGWDNGVWVPKSGEIAPGNGYYVYSANPKTVTMIPNYQYGDVATVDILTGFNLIGYVPKYDGVSFSDRTTLTDGVTGLTAVLRSAVSPSPNADQWAYVWGASGSYSLQNGEAYWVDATGSSTVTASYVVPV
jgi:hypothetical protein